MRIVVFRGGGGGGGDNSEAKMNSSVVNGLFSPTVCVSYSFSFSHLVF